MKKIFKRIISMVLTVCLLFLATVPVFAADEDEEYLADLRLIYADDYDEAKEILSDSDFEDYKIFDANLNENTGKKGVYLAYKTTTDIEDAITDIAIMQMNGGYNAGNYQAMIQNSYNEYLEFGENYLTAINHFNMGVDAGHYLSEIAHRQLNFYNVVTEGIDEIPDFEGELLGDIFYNGIDVSDLATMFMEGNSYALDNIRSLIAMGVSYNENGKTYLENVADEAEKYNADKSVYDNEDYEEIAALIAPVITVFRDMFKELSAYEAELNYEDEDFTDLEIEYLEYMTMAKLMRDVNYLGGKTLYDFCLEYTNSSNYTNLYPLVAAMNEGQLAMAKVNHYYDVVRYSVTMEEDEDLNAELDELEAKYAEHPFNVYEGVDRTIYKDTFALTSAAYRADAFTESGLSAQLAGGAGDFGRAMNIVGIVGASIFGAGLLGHGITKHIVNGYNRKLQAAQMKFLLNNNVTIDNGTFSAYSVLDTIALDLPDDVFPGDQYNSMNIAQKYDFIENLMKNNPDKMPDGFKANFAKIQQSWSYAQKNDPDVMPVHNKAVAAQQAGSKAMGVVYGMYIVGGLMALASAIRLGYEIYNYYHPTYDDIPTAMVDLIDTIDGDRYIKYDVVYEAEYNEDGGYSAADLNAFEANRWNALYFTKSYEAGKPLLADEFVISNTSNVPGEKHMPVHRFGEVVCYNLNKYNFNDDHSIYLSVKQSDNQKAAVKDVPKLVGSVFSAGYYFLAGGVGIVAGVGGTIGTLEIIKRRKNKANTEAAATE